MTELQVINQQQVLGQSFKMYGTSDEPLFLAKDVTEWIEYNKDKVGQMLRTVDEDEKLTSPIHYSGQIREMWFLTEDGLYEVLMQSRKPIAKAFKKEVKKILKNLRKGNLKLPTTYKEALIALVEAEEEKEVMEAQLALAEPKLQALDSLTGNTDMLHTTTQIATNYGISAIKMNKLLHQLGVQYKQSRVWKLYAKYEGQGYTATPTRETEDGYVYKTMLWTPKGEYFLYKLLKELGYTSTTYDLMFKEQDNQ